MIRRSFVVAIVITNTLQFHNYNCTYMFFQGFLGCGCTCVPKKGGDQKGGGHHPE